MRDRSEPGDVNVEYLYKSVMGEIYKAIDEGDLGRAKAMADRGAEGRPKIMPKLDTGTEIERQTAA